MGQLSDKIKFSEKPLDTKGKTSKGGKKKKLIKERVREKLKLKKKMPEEVEGSQLEEGMEEGMEELGEESILKDIIENKKK